jgi:hypothetical protein
MFRPDCQGSLELPVGDSESSGAVPVKKGLHFDLIGHLAEMPEACQAHAGILGCP